MAARGARFSRYLQSWWDRQLQGATYPGEWRHGRDADALAGEFRRAAQFELAQARFLHHRPDEAAARAVVDQLIPELTEADAEIVVAAIVRAGTTAQRVRTTTAAGAVLTVFALVLRNILRGR
ncbi:MAG TPA: hypothetical protein VNF07_08170 [Acidimicrobiales bacterium]|nr:hypothetical protein [Acidimicrobiales bacterium]